MKIATPPLVHDVCGRWWHLLCIDLEKMKLVPGCRAPSDTAAPYRLPVYVACTILALLINCLLGKDMAGDTLSYHLYAGFSAINDRFAQDYFPAGPQSYFNPYVYAPFYYLVRTGLSSLEISSVLAAVHSVILWLTYELAVAVCPSNDRRTRLVFGLYAIIFALINPVLLQQIGSTFADITTAELVLAGWLLLALAVRLPSTALVICAGLLLGTATGLKLTNAVHAISGFAILIMVPLSLRGRLRYEFIYGVSLALCFGVVSAPWSYRLERTFGNPFFPLLNNLFRSPEFTTEPLRHLRFIPATIAEALWRPFAMIDPVTMVHEEFRAPDPRYAVLLVLIAAFLCRWLWLRCETFHSKPALSTNAVPARILAAISCGLAADWALWLSASGNSRYFLPMASVAAVVIVALLYRLLSAQSKARNYILASILGVQGVQLWMGADYRWNPVPWDNHWIRIVVPGRLASEPNLYLTMGIQTNSFIAPYLAHGAGIINFSGGYTLSPIGADGARIEALINRYAPNIRMLIQGERVYRDDELRMPNRARIDDALGPFGLRVDQSDCEKFTVYGLPPDLEFSVATSKLIVPQLRDTTYLLSCRVIPDKTDYSAQMPARRDADLALDRLEDACPALFQPRRTRTEYSGGDGLRRYFNTDVTAWVSHGSVKFHQPSVGGDIIYLGREAEWTKAPLQLKCGRRNGRFFADLLKSKEKT
jgi:Glycosyltransferase family 87